MDEMTLLGELRAGLPAARAEARAAARGQLVARIDEAERPRRSRSSAWRSGRVRLLAAGTAVAAVTAALVLGAFSGGGQVAPAAATVLRDAARAAAIQAPVSPGPGQFVFTRARSAYLSSSGGWSVLSPSRRETWISLDGSRKGRVRTVYGKPRFVSPDQRAAWVAAGSPPLARAGTVEDATISGASIVDPALLPADPDALLEKIEARAIRGVEGPPGEAETFVLIGDLLRQAYLPAAVRAALYEAAAELPGVESLGEVSDPVGRPGLGVAYTDRGTRHELILDAETAALLGERETLVGGGAPYGFSAPPGTTIGWAAYLEAKVVDSIGPDAPGGAGAFDNSVGCYERESLRGSVAILHGDDPLATCAEVWREGAIGPGGVPPELVACADPGTLTPARVFPGSGPAVCARLGLVPLDLSSGGWSPSP
jgi:hypothetical protein